jgi:hypothetical protein
VWRLNELGWLRKIDIITSVTRGSLQNAVLVTCSQKLRWTADNQFCQFERARRVLGLSRVNVYRRLRSSVLGLVSLRPRLSHRALTDNEGNAVLIVLHVERFVDQPPREVGPTLLAEDCYLYSVRSMYRGLLTTDEVRGRRN